MKYSYTTKICLITLFNSALDTRSKNWFKIQQYWQFLLYRNSKQNNNSLDMRVMFENMKIIFYFSLGDIKRDFKQSSIVE